MSEPSKSSLRVDRFMRMPRRNGEVWQGAGMLLPFFVADADTGEPVRQAAIGWANLATDEVMIISATPAEAHDPASLMDAFLDFGSKNRKVREGRPARIEVRDAAMGAFIKASLGDDELEVTVRPDLPRIDEEVTELIRAESQDAQIPGVLDAPGVDVDRLRAFADAARLCYARQVWHDIGPEDLVVIESPAAPDGMAGFAASFGGGEPKFQFYASRAQFDRLHGGGDDDFEHDDDDGDDPDEDADRLERDLAEDNAGTWRAEFVRLHELPIPDVSPWADLGLPVAAADAYPVVAKAIGDDEFTRPDRARLAFLEGLFRALAETTESELDAGRWRREVPTADGAVVYQFAIPPLLDEPAEGEPSRDVEEEAGAALSRFLDEGQFESLDEAFAELGRDGKKPEYPPPQNDDERAQHLVYRSMAALGRRRTQLLRQAVALSPNCYQAYLYLAENATRPGEAIELFEAGRAAGERALGRRWLEEIKGRYWDERLARPYLRLRLGLALALRSLGRREQAVAELREVVGLDEHDRAGARDYLLALLLVLGKDEDAKELLERFEDGGAAWMYGAALLAFRRSPRRSASARLVDAYLASPFSARVLLTETLGPQRAADVGPDEDHVSHDESDEAEECLDLLAEPWLKTAGALEWMASELKTLERKGKRRRRR